MLKFLIAFIALTALGCASEQKTTASGSPVTHLSEDTTSPGEGDEIKDSSQVLSKAKKCPKKTKLVNGKCTLQVESDD